MPQLKNLFVAAMNLVEAPGAYRKGTVDVDEHESNMLFLARLTAIWLLANSNQGEEVDKYIEEYANLFIDMAKDEKMQKLHMTKNRLKGISLQECQIRILATVVAQNQYVSAKESKIMNKQDFEQLVNEKLKDMDTPGAVVEFDPEEAEAAGAFTEEALSYAEALEAAADREE